MSVYLYEQCFYYIGIFHLNSKKYDAFKFLNGGIMNKAKFPFTVYTCVIAATCSYAVMMQGWASRGLLVTVLVLLVSRLLKPTMENQRLSFTFFTVVAT